LEGFVVEGGDGVGDGDCGVGGHAHGGGEGFDHRLKRLGDQKHRGDAPGLHVDGVVQTARGAGPSIAQAGNDEVGAGGQHLGSVGVDGLAGG